MAVDKVYTAREARAILRMGETKFRELYSTGQIYVRRVGRLVLVPESSIAEFLAKDRRAAA